MSRLSRNLLLFSLISTLVVALEAQAQRLTYPQTRQVEHTDDYHGVKIADPYRWMEEAGSPELRAWVNAQDGLLKNFISRNPLRSKIRSRLSELNVYESYTNAIGLNTPYVSKRNARYFFMKTPAGEAAPTLYVQESLEAKAKVLVNIASRYKTEKYNLLGFEPSPNGKLVAVFLAPEGDRWLTLKVFDADTGQELADVLTDLHRLGGNISWANDSQGFFYTKFERQEQGAGQPPVATSPKIFSHALGSPQSADTFIFEQKSSQRVLLSPQASSDGKYLIIHAFEGTSPFNRVYLKELASPKVGVRALFDKTEAVYTYLGNRGTRFWFYTNLNAPRGRVFAVEINKPEENNWKEVVPQSKEVVSGSSSVGGNALGIFGGHLVLLYMRDSNPIIKIFDLNGELEKEVALPSGGTVWGGFSGRQNETEVLYQYLGLTSPALFYRLDLQSKQNQEFLRPKLKLNPAEYETKQVFYMSKDGTRVPMFIAHRKGIKLDGNNPAFMYGYGAGSWVAFMWFQPEMITWMDLGGVYAVPGLRGGGEYGEDWHKAGTKEKKQNTIDDYLAAAEWLINNRYTSPAKLVANGGSASASTAAAAVMQRPELFGAALIDRPFLDMLRYDKFTNGRYFVSDFGTASDPQEFKTLFSYSPYHNIRQGRCYLPTLVMTGEKDQVALSFHAFKFVARMQELQGCANPVMLKLMKGAGHNFGETPEQRIDSWTDALTYLFQVLKISS